METGRQNTKWGGDARGSSYSRSLWTQAKPSSCLSLPVL
ncbi:hypothetical protein T11_109 [Trichinella zimbabwensis]|uniref:Uncharacterized protein n=1 Tax=Trichinella zimbabwensis TaxID=268475 RepID=A0A0V1GKI0_9BILA|nr:hypothetical protein T11_109 [Trichinella zimbabwensis]